MSALKARRFLVTGGAGFIGTHLCRALAGAGSETRVLDLRAPREPVPGVDYSRGDIRHALELESAIRDIETVFHLAAVVGTEECRARPFESYDVNVMGTVRLLEAVRAETDRRGSPVRVILAGTSAVYGNSGGSSGPLAETVPLRPPVSFHGAQKLASEQVLRLYAAHYGIPSLILRLFNVYGPGQDSSSPHAGVIAVFSKLARAGAPLPLHGGGAQTRDFVAVEDAADAFVRAALAPPDACDGSALNIGTGRAVSIEELSRLVIAAAGAGSAAEVAPTRPGDVMHSRADAMRARMVLGWEAVTALETGLERLLAK